MQSIESNNKGEIVMYQPDETIRLEVRVENETVCLDCQRNITKNFFQRCNIFVFFAYYINKKVVNLRHECRDTAHARTSMLASWHSLNRSIANNMEKKNYNKENCAIQLFEGKKVRVAWDEEQEKYYFAVADIVQVLTDSVNPRDYIKKMLRRDPELKSKWGTICPPVEMLAPDGKLRKTQASDLKGIFRIIESIPSKKAEPVRQWLAEVSAQRIDQMIDPELTFQMAVEDYRRQGYSDRWINERMRSIEMRKELTDEWQRSGIHESKDFAILTNVLTKAWSGMTTGEYKRYKGLRKENLRDNMTNIELALNTLAEVATTEYSRQSNPQTMAESKRIAKEGGNVARDARKTMERRWGVPWFRKRKPQIICHLLTEFKNYPKKQKVMNKMMNHKDEKVVVNFINLKN